MQNTNYKSAIAVGVLVFISAIIFIIIAFFIAIVDAGEVGIANTFGSVSDTPLQPGLNLKNPFSNIIKMSVRTQEYTMSAVSQEGQRAGDDSIEVITSDGASINLDVTVFFRLMPEKAAEVYKTLGLGYAETIIRPEIRSTIRGESAKYKVIEVFSEKRGELSQSIFEVLKGSLEKRGIILEDVLLRDVKLPETLTDSINQKLATEQEAQKLDFELEKAKKEAERKVIEARGQSDAQKIINEGLTEKYLYYLYINALKENQGTIYVPTEGGLPLFKNVE